MADYSLVFTLVFSSALVLVLLTKFYLASRQIRHVARHRDQVPAAFAGTILLASHQKAADYTITKARFGLLELAFGTAVLVGWTLLGGIDLLNQALVNSGLPAYGPLVPQLALLAALVIGLPIVALILWIMGSTGVWWWLWAWGVWMGFNLLVLVLYPTVIAPLFNKFQPLEDESLKARVTALMQRCGFAAKGLFVKIGRASCRGRG